MSEWIKTILSKLPINDNLFFSQLWTKRRLVYNGIQGKIDSTDEINSKLLFYSLEKKTNLLVVLSDNEPHRGVAMFAAALLMSAVDLINKKDINHTVLYYGTSASFKKSLSEISINGIYLDSVFDSTYISGSNKKNRGSSDERSNYLPKVICIYHPVQPEHFAQTYKPDWVAIDCSNEIEIDWLNDLLKYCKSKSLPIIGWSQNSFSKVITDFEKHGGHVFYSATEENAKSHRETIHQITPKINIIVPVIFEGAKIDISDGIFKRVKLILLRSGTGNGMRIQIDALKVVWKYLKTLERLIIPLNIYNEEAKAFWRTYSLTDIKSSVERYISLIEGSGSRIANDLNQCYQLLNTIYNDYESSEPPYWTVLSSYCMDRSEEGTLRVIIFSSRSQKQLFSYTLIAKYNISEDELFTDSKIILRTASWFSNIGDDDRTLISGYNVVSPIFMGLPDMYDIGAFYQCVNAFQTSILLYPHQVGALNSILSRFNKKKEEEMKTSIDTLKILTGVCDEPEANSLSSQYILNGKLKTVKIFPDKNYKTVESEQEYAINIGDLHTELSRLFENNVEEDDSGQIISININKDIKYGEDKGDSLIVDGAIKIILEDNHVLLTDPNDQINIIKGKEILKVYSRALKTGDVVLCVQNQVKKDIFDLLVERINDHKSLAIHLNLLQKWREEFYLSYLLWKNESAGRNLQEFWRLLKAQGSDVESTLTISNWLRGHTLRPQDTNNIKRVGQILNNNFIKEHHIEIANAASRIVGLHISLSSKLKKWLDVNVYDLKRTDMILVDKELNLTLGELRSSLKIMRVLKVENFTEPVLRSSIGILMKS